MKKILIATTVVSALCAPAAFAQSENFKGLSLGLGVNVARTASEARLGSGPSFSDSANDYNAALQLQYNLALDKVWVLGLGGTATVGDLKSGSLNGKDIKTKEAYSLFVAPGYAFTSGWIGYAKLAYLNARADSSSGGSTSFDGGYGLGFGAQAMLDKNWFGQVEYMYNQYDDKSSFNERDKLKSDVVTFSVGYKF